MINSLFQQLLKPSITNEAPSAGEAWRNDLAMLATVLFALFLGIGIRNQSLNASQLIELGDGLPSISAPAGWLTQQADSGNFQVRNPESASTFDSEIAVLIRPLEGNQTLDRVRVNGSLQRSKELEFYRELEGQTVEVRPQIGRTRTDAISGVLTTYAYVADPTLASGANGLPVVVEAQDLLFIYDKNLYVVTLAADASAWDNEAKNFQRVLDSLRLTILDEAASDQPVEQAVPAATQAPAATNATQAEEGGQ